jgi:hypothetical protein
MDHLIDFVLRGQLTVAYPRVHQLDRSVREKGLLRDPRERPSTGHKDSTTPAHSHILAVSRPNRLSGSGDVRFAGTDRNVNLRVTGLRTVWPGFNQRVRRQDAEGPESGAALCNASVVTCEPWCT